MGLFKCLFFVFCSLFSVMEHPVYRLSGGCLGLFCFLFFVLCLALWNVLFIGFLKVAWVGEADLLLRR